MKKAIRIGILLVTVLAVSLVGCGMAGDPILDDLYTRNVYPGTAGTYSVGSEGLPYSSGHFNTAMITDAVNASSGNFDELNASKGDYGDVTMNSILSSTVFTIRSDGTIRPVELADAAAPNNSLYFSTTQNKLVYKDNGGVVHDLW